MSVRGKVPERGALALRSGVILYTLAFVALPLVVLVEHGLSEGFGVLADAVGAPVARNALLLTLWTAAITAAVNAVMGTCAAWVLVRYRFPGRGALSSLIDLPFAIPTLVTGIMLVVLFGPQNVLGKSLTEAGFPIAFAPAGIVLALLFITLPIVVRAVEPVMLELDPAEEEASRTLGASNWTTFRKVVLPALFPAILAGGLQTFARALGEFGSIVVVAGNIPLKTLTAPVHVFGEIESGNSVAAAGISIVLLALVLALDFTARRMKRKLGVAHA